MEDIKANKSEEIPIQQKSFQGSLRWNPKIHLPAGTSLLAIQGLKSTDGPKEVLEFVQTMRKDGEKWYRRTEFLLKMAIEYIEGNFLNSSDVVFCKLTPSILHGLYSILSITNVSDNPEETKPSIVNTKTGTAKLVYLNEGTSKENEEKQKADNIAEAIDPKTGWRTRGCLLQYPPSNVKLTKQQEIVFTNLQIMMSLADKNATDKDAAAKAINDYMLKNGSSISPLFYIPPPPMEVDEKMKQIFSDWGKIMPELSKEKENQTPMWKQKVLYFAAHFHQSLILTRPFPVCNGKIARILVNVLLCRFGFEPFWFETMGHVLVYKDSVVKSVIRRSKSFVRPFYCQMCQVYKVEPEKTKIKKEMPLKYKVL